jgi:hypothetical protein
LDSINYVAEFELFATLKMSGGNRENSAISIRTAASSMLQKVTTRHAAK